MVEMQSHIEEERAAGEVQACIRFSCVSGIAHCVMEWGKIAMECTFEDQPWSCFDQRRNNTVHIIALPFKHSLMHASRISLLI